MNGKPDIKEDEIRVIGNSSHTNDDKNNNRWFIVALVAIIALVIAIVVLLTLTRNNDRPVDNGRGDTELNLYEGGVQPDDEWYENSDPSRGSVIDVFDTVFDGVSLRVFTPYNTKPELWVGEIDSLDKSILLCTQAADLRRDNGKILGAFVYRGEPLAWGLSKRGYCAIIDGAVTLGVSDNSPLFEYATERSGYFFRQYPLVDNGEAVMNNPENVAIRRALCSWGDQLRIIVSLDRMTMNEFSLLLSRLGVRDAIYVVGGDSVHGWYDTPEGERKYFFKVPKTIPTNISFIVFRKK